MSFNPDTDANYQAYVAARAKLNGPAADLFDDQLLQYFGQQSTLGSTLNSALFSTALTTAQTAVRQAKSVAPTDANFLTLISGKAGQNGGSDSLEVIGHLIKNHAQLATASTVLSSATVSTAVTNAKSSVRQKRISY